MVTATRSQFQSAIDRAQARAAKIGWARLVKQVRPDAYSVLGSSDRYVVRVHRGEYTCPCPAGAHGQACYHSAACWLVRNHLVGLGRITLRTPAPTIRPTSHGADVPIQQRSSRQTLVLDPEIDGEPVFGRRTA